MDILRNTFEYSVYKCGKKYDLVIIDVQIKVTIRYHYSLSNDYN